MNMILLNLGMPTGTALKINFSAAMAFWLLKSKCYEVVIGDRILKPFRCGDDDGDRISLMHH